MYDNDTHGSYDYQSADLERQVATATPHQLVLIMFNGLMDELIRLKAISRQNAMRKRRRVSIVASIFLMR